MHDNNGLAVEVDLFPEGDESKHRKINALISEQKNSYGCYFMHLEAVAHTGDVVRLRGERFHVLACMYCYVPGCSDVELADDEQMVAEQLLDMRSAGGIPYGIVLRSWVGDKEQPRLTYATFFQLEAARRVFHELRTGVLEVTAVMPNATRAQFELYDRGAKIAESENFSIHR